MNEEFDIDLGVYYEWQGEPEEGRHGPRTLKDFVQDSLEQYAEDNPEDVSEVAAPKPRCCRIRYKNNFHIDVPPYHLDPDRDARSLATDRGWENSDPKAIYVWFRDRFDDASRKKVRRQVKYGKAWAALKFRLENRPSSILLTVLIAEAAEILGADGLGADDDTLRDILELIVERLETNRTVLNPVDKSEDLSRLSEEDFDAFLDRLSEFHDVANRAAERETELGAADIWQEAFEHLFPLPDTSEAVTTAMKRLPVPFATPEIRVTAVPTNNAASRFNGVNKIGPIPKNCDIHFQIANPQVLPSNATITWMVRNEGREAENINDLGHRAGTGLSAEEHSAYKGTHFMDCVVRVAGQIVAMQRVPVSISGLEAPRRNPSRRPSWTKLRGRR